jgi:hypothetical protein
MSPRSRRESVRELADWTPSDGVLSVYVAVDPADRGEGWRIDLRNELDAVANGQDDDLLRIAADRVLDRFPAEEPHAFGLTRVGFVEVSRKPGREQWLSLQMPMPRTVVSHAPRPQLRPLIALLDDGRPRGVAAISAERVRLLRWEMGTLEELDDWTIEIFSLDWRERKAPRSGDPARVQGAKASGRDQHDQRLEHNRDRFLKEAGRLAAEHVKPPDAELLVFGDTAHAREFTSGAGERARHCSESNVISMPLAELSDLVTDAVAELNSKREMELAQQVKAEVAGGSRAAAGPQETLQALDEGRVDHLLYDSTRELSLDPREAPAPTGGNNLSLGEHMVGLALATGAHITPVEGEAAEALDEVGGVVALLRY